MTNEELLKELSLLPGSAKRRIENYISYLKRTHGGTSKKPNLRPIEQEEFVGMWADRDDMSDSTAWVRNLRQEQWTRSK